jgi:hypothetical protein
VFKEAAYPSYIRITVAPYSPDLALQLFCFDKIEKFIEKKSMFS